MHDRQAALPSGISDDSAWPGLRGGPGRRSQTTPGHDPARSGRRLAESGYADIISPRLRKTTKNPNAPANIYVTIQLP